MKSLAVVSTELRTPPATIAHDLKLSRTQEIRIRSIVMESIIEVANSADETINSFEELLGTYKPLSALCEAEILNMSKAEFLLRANAASEKAAKEIVRDVFRALEA